MKRLVFVLGLLLVTGTASAEGLLDLSPVGDFVWERITHGKIAYVGYLGGGRSLAVYTDLRTFHSDSEKAEASGEDVRNYASVAAGGQVDVKNRAILDPFFAAPANIIEISRAIWGGGWAGRHSTGLNLPRELEIWAGPVARMPIDGLRTWTWKTHFGGFLSLGKRFGGAPLKKKED